MKRGYADTPEGQIHFYTHGRGEPLLMLHETPRSAWSFAPLMRRLGAKFRCFAADTLGFGMSDPVPPKAKMEDLAKSMVHLLDALKIERAHVVGFHTGNKIGAALGAHHAGRVGRLVLIGMTHSLVVARKEREAAIMGIVKKYMANHREHPDGIHLLRNWASDYAGLAGVWWNPAVMTGGRITDRALEGLEDRAIEMIQCRRAIKTVYGMNFGFDLAATLRKVKVPTQVIECLMPEEAHLGPQGAKVVKLLKRAELVTLKGAGFDATETHAAQIARASSRFLLKR
jgi:pimeloyl-ACP methyl ester carboxylesterase